MMTERVSLGSATWTRLGTALVLAFFCLPLFISLGEQDLQNDEAIYSYAVDRVLETGEWLTPRAIPFDNAFLEKPPLKVWMVAGLMRAGVVPQDERGLRFVDALFGGMAFLYVYAIGCLLAGPICGVVAVIVLFTFGPLLLDHGLRSNNMEAALILAYCGGIYHFARWEASARRRAAHALAVGAYVVLGFMTKFVAVFFLPLVCVLALAWRRDAWRHVRSTWRSWIAPTLLVAGLSAPWFIYQHLQVGRMLRNIMFGQHIYSRFTGALDPDHLEPWSFYFVEIWREMARVGSAWIVVIGLLLLVARAWTGRPWLTRLLLLWCIVPLALISMGTSKLFHYAFPFLPPLAIGAGYATATAVALVAGPFGAALLGWLRVPALAARMRTFRSAPMLRRVLVAGALIAFFIAAWTAMEGRLLWELGAGLRFSNASISRPLVIGAILIWLGASSLTALHTGLVVPVLVALALPAYVEAVGQLRLQHHPLRTVRDCGLHVQRTNADAGRGLYNAARARANHPYFYYLRRLGPWKFADAPEPQEVRRRLIEDARPSPIIVSREDFGSLVVAVTSTVEAPAAVARATLQEHLEPRQTAVAGIMSPDGVIIVLPGPYQACVGPAVAAGWRAVGDGTASEAGR